MEQEKPNEISIDVKELFYMLIHKIWLIIILGILGAVIAALISIYLIRPVYTSSAKVYVINRQDENKVTYSDIQTGTQLTRDYMILVKSRPVIEKVISDLNLDMTNEELAGMVKVNTPDDTRILEIVVEYYNATLAKQIVDAIAEVSADRMIGVMEIEKVNIVEEGNLPINPSSPNIKFNTFLGLLLGLLLPALVIIIRSLLNDTIKTQEDVEKHLGITVLGIIPREEELNKKRIKTNSKQPKPLRNIKEITDAAS